MDIANIITLAESLLDKKESEIAPTLRLSGFSQEEFERIEGKILDAQKAPHPMMEIIRIIMDALNYRRWRMTQLLEYAKEGSSLISSREVAEAREEAKSYFLGVDDIVIPDNATVQKVSDGYWVEAQVWVDADYSDSLSI